MTELADYGHLNHIGLHVFYGEDLLVASRPRKESLGFLVDP